MDHGFSPEKYKKVTDLQILKKENVHLLEKMRTIILFNSEFNNNNKWTSNKMLYNAEKHGILAKEQYGSRKKHDAITAALNKRLTFDILRLSKQSAVLSSIDAKACYDRIVHNIATICMLRTGINYNTIKSMFLTLSELQHKIKTGYGT